MALKTLCVVGTRPEAIKLAPVIARLRQQPGVSCSVCATGQHREMLDQVLTLFDIAVDHDLKVMQPGQGLVQLTARLLVALGEVLEKDRPDLVIVQGDTTTCFVAALAAFYAGVPVAHVEAGLRTGDLAAPFPEEANRSLVGRLTALHFAPTTAARDNLLAEGIEAERIWVTGNTVIDALLDVSERTRQMPDPPPDIARSLDQDWLAADRRLVLVTGHRRENFGQGFEDLCSAIAALARRHADWCFVYPVHLNPNVQKPVRRILGDIDNIALIDPLEYLPFVWLMDRCDVVLTDSGGIQEEGPSLGKPVLVMREVTERPEAVAAGTVMLVGTSREKIEAGVESVLLDPAVYRRMARAHNPYGDGHAAERIVSAVVAWHNGADAVRSTANTERAKAAS